jgi:hypothetical protein
MWLLACFTAGADGGPCSWSSRSRATASQQPAAASQPAAAAAGAGVLLQQQQTVSMQQPVYQNNPYRYVRTGTAVHSLY